MSLQKPIQKLNPEVARKIAAGEVIDRPNAIVRELIDNAIDSGAKNITVEIYGGGIEKIRIIDDGCGMTKEDLSVCAQPHATSKISTEVDLLNLSTLGFRGEALASIASVSRLQIISGEWKMSSSIVQSNVIEPTAKINGTIVQAEGLFENFPARRQFLKRPATEGLLCKNTFIEKAMAWPELSFKFINEGELKIDLPANQSVKERFIGANSFLEAQDLFIELEEQSNTKTDDIPDWSFKLILGEPSVARNNKKEIYIYTNGRRIQEYSLVQAIEYGCQGFFPNGTYPVAALFATINPKLVDFNIHPAKKEARFYDISDLHHGVSSNIKKYFLSNTRTFISNESELKTQEDLFNSPQQFSAKSESSYTNHINYKSSYQPKSFNDIREKYFKSDNNLNSFKSFSNLSTIALQTQSSNFTQDNIEKTENEIKYIGKCLGTFILIEKDNCLYILDQHAAHERILFDNIMKNQGKSQPLLIPYQINTESKTQDNQLEKIFESLGKIGFNLKKIQDGKWEINTIPERWTGTEYDLRTLLFVKHVEPEEIIRSIAAMTACKAAVKDGYYLDEKTCLELAQKVFLLEDPHCPHGRPIYTIISRERLFELVKRT